MPRSDDRFARQNRGGLPPEFPLASPCPGIDHHLSGPNVYARTPCHRRSGRNGSALRARDLTITPAAEWSHSSRFHCAVVWLGYQAPRLAYRLDSLVRVSRRVGKEAVLLRRRHVAVRRQARRNPPHVPSPYAVVPNTRFRNVATQRRRDGPAEQRVCAFDSYFADG